MVVEVTKQNFRDLYSRIEHVIMNADFIAIDTEFSGLWFDESCKPSLFDSCNERYSKLRKSVENFTVTQIGISTFTGNLAENNSCYCTQTFVFHLFPATFGSHDPRFSLQASCVEFLCKHKFDFNKWLYDGLSYMNCEEEQQVKEDLTNGTLSIERCVDEREVQKICSHVAAWISQSKDGDTLNLPLADDLSPFVLHKDLRSRFPMVWTSTNPFGQLVVERVTPEQRKGLEKEGESSDREQKEKFLEDLLGFTRVFRLLQKAKKPIVGHNLWMDLLFLFEKCHKPLPEKYSVFKQELNKMFPTVFDTKHISYEAKKILDSLKKTWPGNLKELYDLLRSKAIMNTALCQPSVKQEEEGGEGDTDHPHQAGYDAFMCGVVFMRLCHLLKAEKLSSMQMGACSFKSYLPVMRKFCNRVNVIRAVVNFTQLDASEPPSIRPPLLHVKCVVPGHRLSPEQLASWFSVYGTVDVQIEGPQKAVVATASYIVARNILYAFQDHSTIQVTKYRFWQHSRTAKCVWWGAFAVATCSCLLLVFNVRR